MRAEQETPPADRAAGRLKGKPAHKDRNHCSNGCPSKAEVWCSRDQQKHRNRMSDCNARKPHTYGYLEIRTVEESLF